jgi:hypothetical protein
MIAELLVGEWRDVLGAVIVAGLTAAVILGVHAWRNRRTLMDEPWVHPDSPSAAQVWDVPVERHYHATPEGYGFVTPTWGTPEDVTPGSPGRAWDWADDPDYAD